MTLMALKVTVFSILTIQFSVNSIPSSYRQESSRELHNIYVPNPQRFNGNNRSQHNSFERINKLSVPTEVTLDEKTNKKWQVGRVSRKQYEIINMLWRKTKIFIDVDSTTTKSQSNNINFTNRHKNSIKKENPYIFSQVQPKIQPSTASYIEFYYLDDSNENFKNQELVNSHFQQSNRNSRKSSRENSDNLKLPHIRSPFFAFRVNNPNYKSLVTTFPFTKSTKNNPGKSRIDHLPFLHVKRIKKVSSLTNIIPNFYTNKKKKILTNIHSDNFPICPYTTQMLSTDNNTSVADMSILDVFPSLDNGLSNTTLTTIYDKIKFFEMYDRNTRKISNQNAKTTNNIHDEINLVNKKSTENDIRDKKIILQQVDEGIGHHNGSHTNKFVKKHIMKNMNQYHVESPTNYKKEHTRSTGFKKKSLTTSKLNVTLKRSKMESSKSFKEQNLYNQLKLYNGSDTWKSYTNLLSNLSKPALWSEYPFAAVYVYELFQIYCDAAAISPHWLVAAGSCLSRHHLKDPTSGSRSAFVTYCGNNWKRPERVAYVKYSLVHPNYHPMDTLRRNRYNIGVIKVVSSMSSACSRWSPVSLMSHQYTTDQEGSMALAIGWGLDRYDTRYTSTALPKWPLMVYEGLIYSNSCPGNNAYIKAKRQYDAETLNNVYCLSLPPYFGEEHDAVHGSILLVGGKLIALYLQEERRPWGVQSAIYTCVWRLIPWIMDVARESEEVDVFTADI